MSSFVENSEPLACWLLVVPVHGGQLLHRAG